MVDKREKRPSYLNTMSRVANEATSLVASEIREPLDLEFTMDLIECSLRLFIKCELSSISFVHKTVRAVHYSYNPENGDKPEFQCYSKL
jgi:hypothetical protein